MANITNKLIIIKIRGTIGADVNILKTLDILKLRKKFVAVALDPTPSNIGMIKKAGDYIAYGEITKEDFKKLLMARGRLVGDKRIEMGGDKIDKIIDDFFNNKKSLKENNIKDFFRLHPPVGGMKGKLKDRYPKGVLGNHGKDIIKLLTTMY